MLWCFQASCFLGGLAACKLHDYWQTCLFRHHAHMFETFTALLTSPAPASMTVLSRVVSCCLLALLSLHGRLHESAVHTSPGSMTCLACRTQAAAAAAAAAGGQRPGIGPAAASAGGFPTQQGSSRGCSSAVTPGHQQVSAGIHNRRWV